MSRTIKRILTSASIIGLALTSISLSTSAHASQTNEQLNIQAPQKVTATVRKPSKSKVSRPRKTIKRTVRNNGTSGHSDYANYKEDNKMVAVDNSVKEIDNSYYNNYWNRRVGAYAQARKPYYYPDITYNTRALTALPTANYKYAIKGDKLYRSANLHWINKKGAQLLHHQKIHDDIDLRARFGPNASIQSTPQPGEDKKMPDKYGIKMKYHNYPVENSKEEKITWPYRKKYGEAYRFSYWYALSSNARHAYHNALTFLYNNHRHTTIYNCTQGRDRTGTLSILLENILGVSKANIYNDFLLTNYYKHQSSYCNQLSRIDTFYHTIDSKYGSLYNYERKGLWLPNRTLNGLRHYYLKRIHVYFR